MELKSRDEQGRFFKGGVPWNLGLTKISDERVKKYGQSRSINHKPFHYKPFNCKCKQCGKEFRLKPFGIKRGRGIFCSQSCKGKWQSQNIKGIVAPFFGKHHTQGANQSNKEKHTGENNSNFGHPRPPEVREKIKASNLVAYTKTQTWQNWLKGTHRRPTTPEKHLMKIINENNFPLKYIGNGKINIGNMCPDFIHNNEMKKVVEVFGDYWHNLIGKQSETERIQAFRKHGYDCLIIWEHELDNKKDVIRKLEVFLYA